MILQTVYNLSKDDQQLINLLKVDDYCNFMNNQQIDELLNLSRINISW